MHHKEVIALIGNSCQYASETETALLSVSVLSFNKHQHSCYQEVRLSVGEATKTLRFG